MDRLTQLRGDAGNSSNSTIDTTSPPSEAYMTANDSSSKYFSLSEVDATFDISSIKDITSNTEVTPMEPDQLISNLSPISKSSDLLGKQIEAANILSGGVNIFDDNDNSYDGDELVIDDNVDTDEQPDIKTDENLPEVLEEEAKESKDTEVVLQIDGNNVDAIDIGNGLYLYRKEGQEELAAVQIVDDEQQQPSYKFLKVRENAEGNLEVYEEIEIEVPKEMPIKEGKVPVKKPAHVPIKDINKVINDPVSNKGIELKSKPPQIEVSTEKTGSSTAESETNKDVSPDTKTDVNFNGKMMKISDARKSPLIGSFTPMTFHSTPNKEGIPLTKTMVNQQLQPSRNSDNIKKTIEVHTDCKVKLIDTLKSKDADDDRKKSEDPLNKDKFESDPKEVKKDVENVIPSTSENQDILKKSEEDQKVAQNNTDKIEEAKKELVKATNVKDSCEIKVELVKVKTSSVNQTEVAKDKAKTDVIKTNSIQPALDNSLLHETQSVNLKDTSNTQATTLKIEKPEVTENSKLGVENVNNKDLTTVTNIEKPDIKKIMPIVSKVSDNKEFQNKHLNVPVKPLVSENIKTLNKHLNLPTKPVVSENKEILNKNLSVPAKPETLSCSTSETNLKSVKIEIISSKSLTYPESLSLNKEKSTKVDTKSESLSIQHSQVSNSDPVLKKGVVKSDFVLKNESKTEKPSNAQIKINEVDAKVPIVSNHLTVNDKDTVKDINQVNLQTATQQPKVSGTTTTATLKNYINEDSKSEASKPQKPETKIPIPCKDKVKEVAKQDSVPAQTQEKKPIINPESSSKQQEPTKVSVPEINVKPSTSSKTENDDPGKADDTEAKSDNNNQAVPFGKWTEANRQEFLNKIKETKVPASTSNTQQLKQTKDLNRRDVLKKIDSQRQSNNNSKMHEAASKSDPKNEKTFGSKSIAIQESKNALKAEMSGSKSQHSTNITITKVDISQKPKEPPSSTVTNTAQLTNITKNDHLPSQRKEIPNQQLIESVINRAIPAKQIEVKSYKSSSSKGKKGVKYDDIEMKMNELHGIPFVERPIHQLPKVPVPEAQKAPSNKITKIPNLVPYSNKNQRKIITENVPDVYSDEEIIEHEPVTGDSEINKARIYQKSPQKGKQVPAVVTSRDEQEKVKSGAVITENDFDKFARRNSFTYENSLTVNFQSTDSKNGPIIESKPDGSNKPRNNQKVSHNNPVKLHTTSKIVPVSDNNFTKTYPSKVKMAYQSALTAKHQLGSPKIIEDKPVKVVFMESNSDFTPRNINVQGPNLSSAKKVSPDSDNYTCDSLDSEISDPVDEAKTNDVKNKSKHQRKQVLTPVDNPELELIDTRDLGIEVSPKKKRKTDDVKLEKSSRNVVPKKTYLLGRSNTESSSIDSKASVNHLAKESTIHNSLSTIHKEPISALDNLVKAAELIENQAVNINKSNVSLASENNVTLNSDNSVSTPVKRGRGRPRKYPISENTSDKVKAPSPQKKPRLIDAKPPKYIETEDDTTDDELVQENWTMGKINENIVCPICSKLFRSENVVFKHVKHCTGPSPNRSDSGKRSPRYRSSQESDSLSRDSQSSFDDLEEVEKQKAPKKETPKKRNSRDLPPKSSDQDIILIEDTPIKEKPKVDTTERESRKTLKPKIPQKADLVCEICGKTFRQLSYLVNHKLQHKKDAAKKTEAKTKPKTTESAGLKSSSVFDCEVCHKEFRKLHHLVQHRLNHNPSTDVPPRASRKSSAEQVENKTEKTLIRKQSEDQSAGFRCEPCDKSFRKLHHLVEHRETHDGINRQKNTSIPQVSEEKPTAPPQCDVCKKTFRKLHHLIEHREQHMETSSEISDDKSTLSTKDIIHECSMCYMVFPNEHSLNRHSVICLRKKRQSATKNKQSEECETIELDDTTESLHNISEKCDEVKSDEIEDPITKADTSQKTNETQVETTTHITPSETKAKTSVHIDVDKPKPILESKSQKPIETKPETKSLKSELPLDKEIVKQGQAKEIPKKKTIAIEKVASTVTKRQSRSSSSQLPVVDEMKPIAEASDDDEIRYMLNPDFKEDTEGKQFMKVRANKRNSLQFERPNSKDLMKRRISLQHPPKPRLKQKPIETGSTSSNVLKNVTKTPNLKSVPSTDSDDSDVKYSFPKEATEKTVDLKETGTNEQKPLRKSLSQKRKTLGGIAKRKSLGKSMTSKLLVKPSPLKQYKKRAAEVEHRCDCGQLFSSAALLSRHTTIAHTPPRIRRRRSPPPEAQPKYLVTKRKTEQPKTTAVLRKSSARSDVSESVKKEEKTPVSKRKSTKSDEKSNAKSRRSAPHRGVPVPEKMRKLDKKLIK